MVLFLDALECRRFWNGLKDTGGDELPDSASLGRVAVVRTRIEESEVPRPARTGFFLKTVILNQENQGRRRHYTHSKSRIMPAEVVYVSASLTKRRMGQHRNHSRFSCNEWELKKNWHAMTITEILVRSPGPFDAELLCELTAVLCRHSPAWDGTLKRPSPLHLQRQSSTITRILHEARDSDGRNLRQRRMSSVIRRRAKSCRFRPNGPTKCPKPFFIRAFPSGGETTDRFFYPS